MADASDSQGTREMLRALYQEHPADGYWTIARSRPRRRASPCIAVCLWSLRI